MFRALKGTFALLAASSLLAVPAQAQSFEGVVNYTITSGKGQTMDMTYMMKGDKIRQVMHTQGQEVAMLMDLGSHTMTMVMPSQQAYMTMDMNHMAQMAPGMQHQSSEPPKITATGKTETVAGHKCEHYLVGEEQNVDICVAKGMGYYMSGNGVRGHGMGDMPSGANLDAWKKVFKDGFFPLKMEMKDQNGMTMEATSIESKSLPDSLFAPPSGYRQMQMPAGMPSGMQKP